MTSMFSNKKDKKNHEVKITGSTPSRSLEIKYQIWSFFRQSILILATLLSNDRKRGELRIQFQ